MEPKDFIVLIAIPITIAIVIFCYFIALANLSYDQVHAENHSLKFSMSLLSRCWYRFRSNLYINIQKIKNHLKQLTQYERDDYLDSKITRNQNVELRKPNDQFTKTNLESLTHHYLPKRHSLYVKYLISALKDSGNRNIALSGIYGSGKSSILDGLRNDPIWGKHTFTISLSTLTLLNERKEKTHFEQAHIIRQNDSFHDNCFQSDSANGNHLQTTTQKLQQAIVKQLIFANKPSNARQSKYSIPHKISIKVSAAQALLGSIITTSIFMISNHGQKFDTLLQWLNLQTRKGDSGIHSQTAREALMGFTVFFLLFWMFFYFFCPRFRISSIGFDKTSIEINDKSNSYFDDFLDEIIYFFESNSKCNIVIFEDLDRFNDPVIFDNLRELNTLINNAPNVRRTVRFIYAIRDSVFDKEIVKKDLQHQSNVYPKIQQSGSDRVKFFDIIIPVVPFIGQTTSYKYFESNFLDF